MSIQHLLFTLRDSAISQKLNKLIRTTKFRLRTSRDLSLTLVGLWIKMISQIIFHLTEEKTVPHARKSPLNSKIQATKVSIFEKYASIKI
jgi:hypothetical protein